MVPPTSEPTVVQESHAKEHAGLQLQEQLAKLEFQGPPQDPKAGNDELNQYRNQDVTARNDHDCLTQNMQRIRGTSPYPSAVRSQIRSTLDDTSEMDYAHTLDQPGGPPDGHVRRATGGRSPGGTPADLTECDRPAVPRHSETAGATPP